MKRAFSTLCCLEYTPAEIVSLASDCRMDALELRVNSDSLQGFLDDMQFPVNLSERGIAVTDIASGIFVRGAEADPDARRYMDLAVKLGCPAVRVFAASDGEGVLDLTAIAKGLALLCDLAEEQGLEIWLETHSEFSVGHLCRMLYELVGRANLRILWDVLHSIEYGESIEDTAEHLRGIISHVHLKDAYPEKGKREHRLCALGEGSFPFADVIKLLYSEGFDGYLSLEWESPWCPHLRGLYTDERELLNKYNYILDKAGMDK